MKSGVFQDICYFSEIICHMLGLVGICSNRNDFAAHFPVTFENGFCWVRVSKAVFKAPRIDFYAFTPLNKISSITSANLS